MGQSLAQSANSRLAPLILQSIDRDPIPIGPMTASSTHRRLECSRKLLYELAYLLLELACRQDGLPKELALGHSAGVTLEIDIPKQSVNAEAFAILDRSFRAALITYFRRRVGSTAEAEDLTQDVFERILRSSPESIANPAALIFRIAINLLRDRARREHIRGVGESLSQETILEFADALTVDLSPERVVMGERALSDVFAALNELGERTRVIFYLYRLENLKIKDIAEFYGISPSAVEKHVAKALVHLAKRKEMM